ncbi:DNA repair protein rhp54 [Plakobranchus ocellatus]|uniref:DNA repair protein rhp54 n=1 Tax=Plakobranchus ocellatus TaxID=259542 RepID=A0AAV4E013_9GAST|nr:DNA repair protein rhp54 [Plakobranchus ocellatus]
MIYTLAIHEQRKQVCRHMFLSTLGVTERQMRTALKKRQRDGQIAMEARGGRREAEKVEYEEKRQSILDHINKFPRMESHYCRTNTKNEFLAPELYLTTMYNMYVSEMAADKKKPASRSLYNNIFKSLGLKFFALKKDACGICLRKMKENPTDESLLTMYQKHMDEKVKVRQVKEEAKKMASENPKICGAVFDLQQVIYTPKSHHSSIFYKRRPSNYNFTIFDLQSQEGRCFLWHEGIARRGENEISTCIYKFLQEKDSG